ncbi:MAG: hypothetical protein IKY51_04175 [Alistipes sp.]|nr:hypothetical protein [Alistipes sp.]
MDKIKSFIKRIVSYITPGYVAMVIAAFTLWYITKLGENYTTEHEVVVVIDDKEYSVGCTVRGKGTNLISYTFANKNSNFVVPSEELSFDKEVIGDDGRTYRHVTNVSLQQALNARMNDVDVLAVSGVPMILLDE